MFFNPLSIVLLSKTGIFFNYKNHQFGHQLRLTDWSEQQLTQSLTQLNQQIRHLKIKLIVDDDLSYLVRIKIPLTVKIKRANIEEELAKVIPESLANAHWQYKIIGDDQEYNYLQVLVSQNHKLKLFLDVARKTQLNIEAVYSLPYILLSLVKNTEQPLLIIHSLDTNLTLTLIYQHAVIFSQTVSENKMLDSLSEINNYCWQETGLKLSSIYTTSPDLKLKITNSVKNIVILNISKNWINSPALKESPQNDHSTLCLTPDFKDKPITLPSEETLKKPVKKSFTLKKFETKTGLLLFFLCLSLLGLVFTIYPKRAQKPDFPEVIVVKNIPTPQPLATSPAPTPKQITPTNYTIEVLNGSGTVGEAAKVTQLLSNAGYNVIKTGNAKQSNYQQTIILTTEPILSDLISSQLNPSYEIASQSNEVKNSTASAVVIIGKNKR